MNFDGLTDSVTNLVGSLILLVVLVVAVTKPKIEGVTDLPPPDNTAGAQRPIDPLLEELRVMRDRITELDRDVQRMEGRVPELEVEIQALKDKTMGGC
jgi:hypothetical protein